MLVTFRGFELAVDPARLDVTEPELRRQLAAYERGERRSFDLAVAFPDGLTGRVMEAMVAIPYGETRTYGDLAAALDTSPVAVGQACGRNPTPIVVPCHRVVGADSLGGFSASVADRGGATNGASGDEGPGVPRTVRADDTPASRDRGRELKRALLAHEGALVGAPDGSRQARLTREWPR